MLSERLLNPVNTSWTDADSYTHHTPISFHSHSTQPSEHLLDWCRQLHTPQSNQLPLTWHSAQWTPTGLTQTATNETLQSASTDMALNPVNTSWTDADSHTHHTPISFHSHGTQLSEHLLDWRRQLQTKHYNQLPLTWHSTHWTPPGLTQTATHTTLQSASTHTALNPVNTSWTDADSHTHHTPISFHWHGKYVPSPLIRDRVDQWSMICSEGHEWTKSLSTNITLNSQCRKITICPGPCSVHVTTGHTERSVLMTMHGMHGGLRLSPGPPACSNTGDITAT